VMSHHHDVVLPYFSSIDSFNHSFNSLLIPW
jgi:hypothetical protein